METIEISIEKLKAAYKNSTQEMKRFLEFTFGEKCFSETAEAEAEAEAEEEALIDVFMEQAWFYQKAIHDLVQDYQQKGLDVSTMSLIHCEVAPGTTRVGRSFLAAPEDILSMLDDINKAFPGIIEKYMLIKKNR